jgi:toxin HigB-1
VIVSFAEPATEALHQGVPHRLHRRIPADLVRAIVRKLDMMHAAHELLDLRTPPGNRLEALRGDLAGLHSVRVNDPWRLVFRWTPNGPAEVRLLDYH